MKTTLAEQLALYLRFQRKLARARRRMLRNPTPLMVRNFFAALEASTLFAESLLMLVPTAHDEAVYALSTPHPSDLDSLIL